MISSSLSVAMDHPRYPAFANPDYRMFLMSNLLTHNDTVIYKTGFYSLDGTNWTAFNFSGKQYVNSEWISGFASFNTPNLWEGENYFIAYSCTYNNSAWDCHEGKWQLWAVQYHNGLCENKTCPAGEYCFEGYCLLNVSGNTYFVEVYGNDNNSGNYDNPWQSWQKAFDTARAGDIVYFTDGIWYENKEVTHNPYAGHGYRGTTQEPIYFRNFPGAKPILDFSKHTQTHGTLVGLSLSNSNNINVKGLTVRNLHQYAEQQWIAGIATSNITKLTFENVVSSGHGGSGFFIGGYDILNLTNCDSRDNIDYTSTGIPGGRADGFNIASGGLDTDTHKIAYITGCRAYNNSDDGFDLSTTKQFKMADSWSFYNGRLQGDGVAFKVAYSNMRNPQERRIQNCIAAYNTHAGFAALNLLHETDGPVCEYLNNFVYKSETGFQSSPGTWNFTSYLTGNDIMKNNIVYDTNASYVDLRQAWLYAEWYGYPDYVTASNNTWRLKRTASPWVELNPAYSVTNSDFTNLDVSQLFALRKSDGSLPDITFGQLASDSDLVDGGTIVTGYHCATKGAHPQENCKVWYGNAPDLGPFESQYTRIFCGDNICSGNETCSNCVQDCACVTGQHCSNNACVADAIISYTPLFCGLHAIHTNFSDGVMNISSSADSVRNNFNCGSTNDHDSYPTKRTQAQWDAITQISNLYNNEGTFTYFFGMEWTTAKPDIHYITLNPSPTPKTSADADFNTVVEVADWLSKNQGVGQIAHPARVNQMNFSNPALYNETWIPLVEFKNYDKFHWNYYWDCAPNSGCTTYQNPKLIDGQVPNSQGWIKYGLDRGIHLGFSCGNDYHGALPFQPICFTGISGGPQNSRIAIYNALKARHTWAAEEKTAMSVFVNNGSSNFIMGDIFNTSLSSVTFTYIINASQGQKVNYTNLFYNGVIINVTNHNIANVQGSINVPLRVNQEDYIFIEAVQGNGKRAWTSPIWVTRRT
jgi:hypothetical protein